MSRLALAASMLGALLLAGCGSRCSASNCSGCCDASGACVSPSANACGLGGASCAVCVGVQQCVGGVCTSPNTSGGGGATSASTSSSTSSSSGSSTSTSTSTSTSSTTGSASSTTTSSSTTSSGSGSTGSTGSTTSSSSSSSGSTGLSPDVVLVVDRSGSMSDSPDGTQTFVCPQAGQQHLNCKWDELLTAITGDSNPSAGFLGQLAGQFPSGSPAQIGMVTFSGFSPDGGSDIQNVCSPGVLTQPLTALDISEVASINNLLLVIPPGGGTPTAASLGVAGQALAADTSSRARYVVLLTDGAPNCDGSFVATSTNCAPNTDRCVSTGACYGESASPWGCLDDTATIGAVQTLASSGVKTVVIGFGADFANTSSAVNQTLDQMAVAGQLARTWDDGGTAEPAFYNAASSTDLQAALSAVLGQIH